MRIMAPTEKRHTALSVTTNILIRTKRASPRKPAKLAGSIVSLRPVYDPAALLFAKDMYRWLQSLRLVEEKGWDWYAALSADAKVEVQVWVDFAVEWDRNALWSTAPITWVGAQDADETGVGDWLGKMGTCEKGVHGH